MKHKKTFFSSTVNTKLGNMLVISDDNTILLLEFSDSRNLDSEVDRLLSKNNATLVQGVSKAIASIEQELSLYFEGKLKVFKTPLTLTGTLFQKQVWDALLKIPYGETRSYLDIAKAINNPMGCRAVARANAANSIPIVIPCHRVINHNGGLGGYSGGLSRKKYLLELECQRAVDA